MSNKRPTIKDELTLSPITGVDRGGLTYSEPSTIGETLAQQGFDIEQEPDGWKTATAIREKAQSRERK